MMPKQILTLLCLLCATAAASAQTEVKDSLGVDSPQANTPAALLKGRVSGVLVTATDGSPAGAVNTYIRGINTLADDSQPLWIVDGVMLNHSQNLNLDPFWTDPGRVYVPAFNELSFLNPYDIESIEVLKDAAATALYGPRGANGVIIVTTGKAKEKALDIRWNSNVSISTAGQVDGTRSALGHNHSLRVSTNKRQASYYLSGFFRQEKGVVAGCDNLLGGLRIGFDASANRVFQTGLNCSLSVGRQGSAAGVNEPGEPSRTLTMRYPSLEGCTLEGWDGDYVDYSNEYRLVNAAYLNINFLENLSLRADVGVDYQNTSRYFWYGNGTPFGLEKNGANAILTGSSFGYNAKVALNYATTYEAIDIKLNAGVELLGGKDKLGNMSGSDMFSHFLREKSINIMASKPESHRIDEDYAHQGFFVNPSFLFGSAVGLNLVLRADSTPRFDQGKYVWYPGATLFFDMKEAFFGASDSVSLLKLSAGWGASGTERVIPYISFPYYSLVDPIPVTAGLEDFYTSFLRTRSAEYNVRLEAGFLDRFTFSAAWYDRTSTEKLGLYICGKPMLHSPEYFEKTEPLRFARCNEFGLKNRGVEFDLSADILKADGLLWNVSANVAANNHSNDRKADADYARVLPKYFGGAGTTFSIGGFFFDALANFVGGNEILNLNKAAKDGLPENLDGLYEKGDYVRLSRVSVGYELPVSVKWIQSVKVHVSGNNLLTVSKYSGWNPDVNCYGRQAARYGVDYGSFPLAKTFLVGVNVNF
jgi:TonB-dependent SusC/RagA subfamily outer membrane receptor